MEKNYIIWDSNDEAILRDSERLDFSAELPEVREDGRFSLYFTGESKLHELWRDEVDFQHLYGLIDDSLNNTESYLSRYCLDLSMKGGENFVKRAVKKLVWPPSLFDVHDLLDGGELWRCGIYAKAREVVISEGGFLRLRFEIRNEREGREKGLTDLPPDRVETVDIPEGSYEWQSFEKTVIIPNELTASVTVYLEGSNYSGEVYFERPFMISETGYNILPDFSTSVQNRPQFDWYGCNLSRRERPRFKITVNGKAVFDGERFEAMHRYPSFEFDLPEGVIKSGKNDFSIEYTASYREPAPFGIDRVRLIERGGRLSIVGHRENAVIGKELPILIRTTADGIKASFECDGGELECVTELYFKKAGLHTVILIPKVMKNHLRFALKANGERIEREISHVCRRDDDRVITGTGDAVYVNLDSPEFFEKYLEWYAENDIGQLLTLRPIYRWGGTRTLNAEVWKEAVRLMDSMGYSYSMMTDGRDVPGYDKHPTPEMISGKGFLGYQLHERDGQFFYWSYRAAKPVQNFQILDEIYDVCMRLYRESPESMSSVYKPCNVKMEKGKYSLRCDTNLGYDSRDISDGIVRQLSDIRDGFTRHTGPAVNFRSFFKSGYKWVGAETMYSSTEPQMAFLRGASKAYGADSMGVHVAVQWSCRPHNSEIRDRLYRLALYVPYMCGATEINTEEGLLRIESGYSAYDKYSQTCKRHLAQQKDFNRYVTSHTRRGSFKTPIALIYGRDDNWTGYHTSTRVICGCHTLQSGDMSASWDLLKVFYPDSSMRGVTPCVLNAEDKVHMYSETPFGNVDVLPIEADCLDGYSLICMAGYNRAVFEDMDRLMSFAERGGTLVMGWPHISDTSDFRDVIEYRHAFSENSAVSLVGGAPSFVSDSYKGSRIRVSDRITDDCTVLERTDSGAPLAVSIPVGEGRVIFVNALEYPGNEGLIGLYTELVRIQSKLVVDKESVWIECERGVEFSAYDDADGTRYLYLTVSDAIGDPNAVRHADLRVGEHRYSMGLTFGKLIKIAVRDGVAVWADGENAEISSVSKDRICVSGWDNVMLSIARDGYVKTMELDLSDDSEITLDI